MKYTLLMLIIVTVCSFSQTADSARAFVSLNVGGTNTARKHFENTYDSKLGMSYGVSVGVPLFRQLYFYGRATYFSKNGVPVVNIFTYDTISHSFVQLSDQKEGTATFSQWYFNYGLSYTYEATEEYTVSLVGGVTFTRFTEKKNSPTGGNYFMTGSGFMGYFGGIGIERKYLNTPFSLVMELQQNISRKEILNAIDDFGATQFNLGVRYYFSDRRKKYSVQPILVQ